MKQKCPAELNSRVIRINVGTYLVLREMSHKLNITMAEALDMAVTEQSRREQVTVIPRTQLRMIPVTTSMAVNGSKAAALASKAVTALANKPKGVRYE